MFASSFRRFGAGLALSAVAVLAGCDKPEPLASTTGSISDLVTNVSVRGGTVPGVLELGVVPTGTLGPTATVAGITAAVNGGSAAMDVTGSDTYTRLLISAVGTDDYYSVPLPTGSTLENVVVIAVPNHQRQPAAPAVCARGCQWHRAVRRADAARHSGRQRRLPGERGLDRCERCGPACLRPEWRARLLRQSDRDDRRQARHRLERGVHHRQHEQSRTSSGRSMRRRRASTGWSCTTTTTAASPRSDWVVTVLLKGQAPAITTGSFVGLAGREPGRRDRELHLLINR